MPDRSIDPREYGQLETQVAQLTKDVHALKENVQAMRDLMEQSKGSWRTLVWLGGIAAAGGATVSWLLNHIKLSP